MTEEFFFESGNVKNCPLCGSRPVIEKSKRWPKWARVMHWGWTVVCKASGCPIRNADVTYFLTRREAIEKWNTRTEEK